MALYQSITIIIIIIMSTGLTDRPQNTDRHTSNENNTSALHSLHLAEITVWT